MVYAPKRIRHAARRQSEDVDLTTDEINERDVQAAEWQADETVRTDIENKTQIAIDYLRNRDYQTALTFIQNDVSLSAGQKILLTQIVRGQMAIVQILRQIGRTLDPTA